jgi:hypothetical protein
MEARRLIKRKKEKTRLGASKGLVIEDLETGNLSLIKLLSLLQLHNLSILLFNGSLIASELYSNAMLNIG